MAQERIPDALFFRVFDVRPGKSEETKLRILQAAIELIATRGYEATTFDAIGKAVKMGRTHVNYYFTSREELLRTAVRYAIALGQQIIIEHVADSSDWHDRLRRVVEGPFKWLEKYPQHGPLMLIFYHRCATDEDHKKTQTMIRQGGEDRALACLEPLVLAGRLPKKRAKEIARTTQALITGFLLNYACSEYETTLSALQKLAVATAHELVENSLTSGSGKSRN